MKKLLIIIILIILVIIINFFNYYMKIDFIKKTGNEFSKNLIFDIINKNNIDEFWSKFYYDGTKLKKIVYIIDKVKKFEIISKKKYVIELLLYCNLINGDNTIIKIELKYSLINSFWFINNIEYLSK